MNAGSRVAAPLLALAGASCGKVPIHDVDAGFSLADASWFAEEQTLFIFYEVTAEQGLGEPSVIEITYATDDERVPWTPVGELPTVHTHVSVDCGTRSLCGSTSLPVELEPREVAIRLRYHRDGELALEPDTVFNVVGPGDPWSHRSLLVYGVFDETNQWVQWRARHVFPTVRNEQATALGLRRDFTVADQRYGTDDLASSDDPYAYGVDCPGAFATTDLAEIGTDERAVFNEEQLPLDASDESTVCAQATVTDATGTFTTGAVARKNPEVRAAFPLLRSPVRDATPIPFFLEPCHRTISAEHEAMQRQRLLVDDLSPTCIDDWEQAGFVDALVEEMSDAVEAERPAGNDMVLVVGLNQDEPGAVDAVQEALGEFVPDEHHRSSPRLAGAFVFDSDTGGIDLPGLSSSTLWCPATLALGEGSDIPDASQRTCAIMPDNPDFELGPFTFGTLPILPSREQYLDFIDTYSERQAGEVSTLTFRTPEFATTADHIEIGEYGSVTFLNDELISADGDDAFSYCTGDESAFFVFRSEVSQSDEFAALIAEQCDTGKLPEEFCLFAEGGALPIEWLVEWHQTFWESSYDIGIFWDFPFLLRMEYEVYLAGAVGAFGLSVPFGLAQPGESYLGTSMWTADAFSLEEALTQCTRFCDHPTFDSAGVYHVTDPFRSTYASACYQPAYPEPGDSGFPLDP